MMAQAIARVETRTDWEKLMDYGGARLSVRRQWCRLLSFEQGGNTLVNLESLRVVSGKHGWHVVWS